MGFANLGLIDQISVIDIMRIFGEKFILFTCRTIQPVLQMLENYYSASGFGQREIYHIYEYVILKSWL